MGSVFHRLGEDRAGSVSAVFRAFAVFGVLAFTNNIAEAGNALFHQHPNGLLVIEAEQFQWNQGGRGVAAWQIVSPSGASGGGALKAPTGLFTSAPDTARSDYYANFVSTGYHYLWARVRAFNDGSDSMYVQIDSRTHVQISASNRTGQWHWVRMAGAHYMSSGVHTLKLYRRESNIEVDRFLLT
jgi:hypothetical protein